MKKSNEQLDLTEAVGAASQSGFSTKNQTGAELDYNDEGLPSAMHTIKVAGPGLKRPGRKNTRFKLKMLPWHMEIYKKIMNIVDYTYTILEKYPKNEKYFGLATDMKLRVNKILEQTIDIISFNNRERRSELIHKIDTDLKVLEVLIEISYKRRYLSAKNFNAYAQMVAELHAMMIKYDKELAKKAKEATATKA
jgi:hypothetical protein